MKKGRVNRKVKSILKNLHTFWDFVWNGDSLLSWITFIVLAVIFIKFIFFPFLTLITGTSLPLVIVESCSMYHGERLDDFWDRKGDWYEDKGIYKEDFSSFRFKNGFNKGDIFFILGVEKGDIGIGDIIIFSGGNYGRPIIHRVVGLNPLETKGDNNPMQLGAGNGNFEQIDETDIEEWRIIGKATPIRVPYLGWAKLIFYEPFRSKEQRGFCKIDVP